MNLPAGMNQLLVTDLQRICGTPDLLVWLEGRCSGLARLGISNRCVVLTSKSLLESARIAEIVCASKINGLACLTASALNGYKISVRGFLSSQDRRFAIAHEIAHTFWYRTDATGIPLSRLQAPYGIDETIEWLSNRAAAALLVPKLFLEDYPHDTLIQVYMGSLHLLQRCAHQLDVPERLLARRVSHDLLNQQNILLGLDVPTREESDACIDWALLPQSARQEDRRKLERKRIPRNAIPQIPQGQTKQTTISGRWRSFLASRLERSRMSTFAKCTEAPALAATVGLLGSRLIISIPLGQFD